MSFVSDALGTALTGFTRLVTGAQARLVLVEGHVEGPVKVVLDGPVAAHGVGEGFGREGA